MPNAPYARDSRNLFRTDPSKVMHLAKDGLAERGFEIQRLARNDAHCLTLISPGWARCVLSIEDDGAVCWECKPAAGRDADPERPERGQVRLGDNADTVWDWSCRDPLIGNTDAAAKLIERVLADATDLAKLH